VPECYVRHQTATSLDRPAQFFSHAISDVAPEIQVLFLNEDNMKCTLCYRRRTPPALPAPQILNKFILTDEWTETKGPFPGAFLLYDNSPEANILRPSQFPPILFYSQIIAHINSKGLSTTNHIKMCYFVFLLPSCVYIYMCVCVCVRVCVCMYVYVCVCLKNNVVILIFRVQIYNLL